MLCIISCYQIELTTEIQHLLENGTCKTQEEIRNFKISLLILKYKMIVQNLHTHTHTHINPDSFTDEFYQISKKNSHHREHVKDNKTFLKIIL